MKATATVIVTYNAMQWIDACLASVVETLIIVIDNNSKDNTVSHIKSKYPAVCLFPQGKNLGFGAGNNLGIKYALEQGAEHILLLNQDAKMHANSLSGLVSFQKKNNQYGLLSPIHLDWSGEFLEASFSRYVAYKHNSSFYSDFVLGKHLKDVYDVPMVAAACWLLSKKALLKVGGFDPLFFHLGEDVNLCQRLLFHKIKIGVIPNTYVNHDTKERVNKKIVRYSKEYINHNNYWSKAKYADVNINEPLAKMEYHKKQLIKKTLTYFLTLKFKLAKGAYKEYKDFNMTIPKALKSIDNNRKEGPHYIK
ncbi:hypothetical protein ULMS_23170 [Patiriisocius marinistellae]|uniref:Glycosyltransferase 2-like domain-containing protein n=1 Tax=Patiriisocius marinistellae TaxID=2494560 RepID=A0A5J4G251_9FLAO|nr:glycosyltransferase family 2 protein [Patiriisocius marinistellae]GEQ86809.1 hypothetical protein ULMS_23170 [Patiriisocius marinistellae]